MKVNETDSAALEYSKKLDSKIRNQNTSKEAELEKIKAINEKRLDEAKNEGEERYINGLRRNDELLVTATKEYEDKLNSYKQNLDRTQKNIAQEENALKSEHEQKMQNAREMHSNNIQEHYENANRSEKSLNQQVINNIHTISEKSRAEKNHLESKARNEVNSLASEYNQKGLSDERNFRSKLDADVRSHEDQVRLQKTELKNVIDRNTAQHTRLETEKMRAQKQELDFLDNHQKDMLAQKQQDFQVRYENLAKEHESVLSELKTHLEADVKKMIEQTSSQKRMIANKIEDRFYQVETLHPTVSESEKDYIVSLVIPEHEKENVHLSVHGREVKMTLTRRFTETLESDGISNKTTRNELFSREFASKDILNQKGISQKYENGVLSFKIQKL